MDDPIKKGFGYQYLLTVGYKTIRHIEEMINNIPILSI